MNHVLRKTWSKSTLRLHAAGLHIVAAMLCIAVGQPAYAQLRVEIEPRCSDSDGVVLGPRLTVGSAPGRDARGFTGISRETVRISDDMRLVTSLQAIPTSANSHNGVEPSINGSLMSLRLMGTRWIIVQVVNAGQFTTVSRLADGPLSSSRGARFGYGCGWRPEPMRRLPFLKDAWRHGTLLVRGGMARDLIASEKLIGLSKVEMFSLLGRPEFHRTKAARYQVGFAGTEFDYAIAHFPRSAYSGTGKPFLSVRVQDDRVTAAWMSQRH